MSKEFLVCKEEHDKLVNFAYKCRGYSDEEAEAAAAMCTKACWYGIKTHSTLKALHLDDLFGSKVGGCIPKSRIEVIDNQFKASEVWNAHLKLGQFVARKAFNRCIELADEYGIGTVSVDNAFHYLWGGGYVMEVAQKGYIAYTNCTSALAEVVPLGGKFPTLGTNPHSWAFPTQGFLGFPICVDWATSAIAMGRVQQFKREGKLLPSGVAIDAEGRETRDPDSVYALLPFGLHKGYGLSLINELYSAYTGGFLPTLRGKKHQQKSSCTFFFQVIHPEALGGKDFVGGDYRSNVRSVVEDILSHGNEGCLLPGEMEYKAGKRSEELGGLIFGEEEFQELNELAEEINYNQLQGEEL